MSKLPKFRSGDEIEITSPELCMRGTLFPAKVIGRALNKAKLVVEYKTLKAKDSNITGGPLIEAVDRMHVRPKQPADEPGREFKLNDAVHAFYNGGWREGVIAEVLESAGRFVVQFRASKDLHEFGVSDVRVHRKWIQGSWDPPFDDEDMLSYPIAMLKRKERFTSGELVEIRTDEEGFTGAWFAATIINPVKKGKYLVEYKDLRNDDNTEPLKEVIEAKHIRPYPPDFVVVDGYSVNENVDALYNDAWWEGTVCKILCGARYKVYFKGTDDEMVFKYFDLRPHQDWINDTWVATSPV